MSLTRFPATTWVKPARVGREDGTSQFHVDFRLGPCRLARTALEVRIVDLGEAAVFGKDIDLSPILDGQLFLRSVPERLVPGILQQGNSAVVYPFYHYDRCWVATEGDFDVYLASFSKTSRKGLRRRTKQLASASGGALDIRHFSTGDVMAAYHADARMISAKTFQERLMDDGLPDSDDFRREMIRKAKSDQCYGSILYLDGQPISYLYCERQGSGWIAVYGGFDPAHARLSPGTVHLLSVLESAFGDPGCDLFDFGPAIATTSRFLRPIKCRHRTFWCLEKACGTGSSSAPIERW